MEAFNKNESNLDVAKCDNKLIYNNLGVAKCDTKIKLKLNSPLMELARHDRL